MATTIVVWCEEVQVWIDALNAFQHESATFYYGSLRRIYQLLLDGY